MSLAKGKSGVEEFSFASFIHLATLPHPRLMSAKELTKQMISSLDCQLEKDFTIGLRRAYQLAIKNQEILVVTGSFFILQPAKYVLRKFLPYNPKNRGAGFAVRPSMVGYNPMFSG